MRWLFRFVLLLLERRVENRTPSLEFLLWRDKRRRRKKKPDGEREAQWYIPPFLGK